MSDDFVTRLQGLTHVDRVQAIVEDGSLLDAVFAALAAEREAHAKTRKDVKYEWRTAIEIALGVQSDPTNHTSRWAHDVVLEIREIGNAALRAQRCGTPEDLALRFHEVYERLAPSFGYETRTETRQFDPTTPNGRLMIAVCGELMVPQASTGGTCVWSLADEDASHYETSCGHAFELTEGGPAENGMAFCPYCGGRLSVLR